MSRLRAKCPDCRTFTAVALGTDYQCHSCGREFRAGLVRVPRAWGLGGEAMAEAAQLALPYPETAVIEEDSLAEQTFAIAAALPELPLVLGGCCCSHIGAIEGLAARHDRIAVVWIDAHGDLNTPVSSPSGNAWGMPLRFLLEDGTIETCNVAHIGARNLDPPEVDYLAKSGVQHGPGAVKRALHGAEGVYVAFDCDVLLPGEMSVFMPEPDGPTVAEVERLLGDVRTHAPVLGAGFTGHTADPANVPALERFAAALGL